MKRKSLLLTAVATIGLTAATMAQTVPSYVPTNGLVGWWPFNGNANDESGNGNNGTVNGATLTTDRFGNAGTAYSFDGVSNLITVQHNTSLEFTGSQQTISYWVLLPAYQNTGKANNNIYKASYGTGPNGFRSIFYNINGATEILCYIANGSYTTAKTVGGNYTTLLALNTWHHIIYTNDNSFLKLYVDGILITMTPNNGTIIGSSTSPLYFGGPNQPNSSTDSFFAGNMDDIGIWNRSLTECEIQDLYNAQLGSFSNTAVTVNPTNAAIGSNAILSVSSPIASLQWQSNPSNVGWVNLLNNTQYSGVTNDTLVVSNLQLSNHNQPFRVLACGDTSNIATIQIADTCITNVTIYDTLLTTVTDTLIINTTLSLPAPNNQNTILIYPNPASDHITIDNGNYSAMAGYSIKIENNAGQQVFQSAVNQPQFYIDLSTWSGNGLYFVHLIDPQNNTVTVRKIVLQ
jgi:hypothetical protein